MNDQDSQILRLLAFQLLPVLAQEIVTRSNGSVERRGLYQRLSKLEDQGLVRTETVYDTVWGRMTIPRLVYAITERGRKQHQTGVAC